MRRPLVSIVTPSYEQARFLRAALDSVLSQDYPAIESIVVDGGSRDGSVEILRSYGQRVRWVSEPDGGQADALNKGFGMARGEIVAWLNSDDLLLKGAVSAAVEALEADPRLGFVYGEGWTIDEAGRRLERFAYTEPFNLWRLIRFGDTILQQSVFMRRTALEAVGGLDPGLRWGLDWDLFIRLGKRFPARRLERDMGAIRVYGETKTASGGFRRAFELARIARRHTRTWLAPSALGFLLGAADEAARRRLAAPAGSPRRLAGWALDGIRERASRWVLPAMEECQGWLADGWALRRAHALFPPVDGAARFEAEGEAAPGGQTLEVRFDGRPAWRERLPSGRFRLAVPLPADAFARGPLHVELRAGRAAERRPRPLGGRRRLYYRLDAMRIAGPSVALECGRPRSIFGPPGASDATMEESAEGAAASR